MVAPTVALASPTTPTMTGPNAGSKLASLPEELLSNIAVKLGSDDIFSLRLTCRDIDAKTLHEFANEYFAAKCFMLTTESLQTFVNIAKSRKLRGKLRNVSILTASFPDRTVNCSHGSCCSWQPTVRQREAFLFYMKDQETLKKTKRDRALLTEAFRELPDLRQLYLVDHTAVIPASNQTAWGMHKILRTTVNRPAYAPINDSTQVEYYAFLSHVWSTLLHAVADSGLNTLTTFQTRMKSHVHGISPITDLRLKQDTLNKLAVSFAKLETVGIQLRSQYLRKNREDMEADLQKASTTIKAFAPMFKAATHVKFSSDYLDWSGALCNTFANALDLKTLKSVTFDSIYIDGKTLGLVVSRLLSAEKLTFHAIDLKSSSWVTLLKILQKLPNLNHLHLQLLQQAAQKVYFLQQPDEEEDHSAPPESDWLGGGHPEDDDWTEEEDSDDESDEEPPDLIPQTAVDTQPTLVAQSQANSSAATKPEKPVNKCPHYTGKDYKAPGCDTTTERGYYVCLATREDIEEQLPNFIADCNLGESYDDMGINGLLAMAGLPPNAGGIMGGAVTVPIGPPPPGSGAGGAAGPPPPPGNNAGQPPPGGLNALTAALNAMILGPGGPPPQMGPNGFAISIPAGNILGHHPPPPNAPGNGQAGNAAAVPAPAQPQAAAGATNVPTAAATPNPAPAAPFGGGPSGAAMWDHEDLVGDGDVWMNDEVEPGWMDDVD